MASASKARAVSYTHLDVYKRQEQMSALFISPSYSDMIVFVTFIIILVVRQVMILRRR